MKIKGVVFDKDGTLIDFSGTYGPSTTKLIEILSGSNEQAGTNMARAIDFDLVTETFDPASILIAGTGRDIAEQWLPHLTDWNIDDLATEVDRLYVDITQQYVRPFDDTKPSLDQLKAMGLKLGVATNDAEEGAHAHMKGISMHEMFDFIAGYDSGFGGKPGPGMVQAFGKAIEAAPGESIMVGDSLHDLHAGRAAGAITVGLTTGIATRETLAPHADHVFDNLSQMVVMITEMVSQVRKPG